MSARARLAAPLRRALHEGAARWPWFRSIVRTGARELDRALHDDLYADGYYGDAGGSPLEIGTSEYTRTSTHAGEAAYLVWRFLPVQRTVDVGCAFGFCVEAERELGLDARGVDVSQYALDHAALGARGHVQYGNLLYRLPFHRGAFEAVSLFETLEHLPPEAVARALREIRRICAGYVIATIPSFGPNPNGPGGWLDVKVRPERLDHYRALGDAYDGPVPFDDLYRDEDGRPVEGHLTIASFAWWSRQFAAAGFVRCDAVERRIHPHLARFGLTKYWNLYVFRVPGAGEPAADVRSPDEIADVEKRFGLDERVADPEDAARVQQALGS
ncbi:MAG TPA: class I SAM-dependent methyltransferase [Acidimicrobiia bacterium]|nr:class I SAM-dependent methyltransferase [Acidimicrobiia bacterium]